MATSATKWLAACLYYSEPWEALLTKAVQPYIEVALQTGVAEQFFYERSWERGPHLRLWFKSSEFLLESMLKPNLLEHFQQYFEAKPSTLDKSLFSSTDKFLPNNSVQFLDLEPLVPNVGLLGKSLMVQQYQAASRFVLKLIKEKEGHWSAYDKTSTALKLNLSLLHAAGFTQKEAQKFANWLFKNWALSYLKNSTSSQALESEMLLNSFHEAFDENGQQLTSNVSATWELLRNYKSIEDASFLKWIHANIQLSIELSLGLEAGKIKPLQTQLASYKPEWTFYANFLMHLNNCLGVVGKNEGYLYFAIAQSLSQMNQLSLNFSKKDSLKIHAA